MNISTLKEVNEAEIESIKNSIEMNHLKLRPGQVYDVFTDFDLMINSADGNEVSDTHICYPMQDTLIEEVANPKKMDKMYIIIDHSKLGNLISDDSITEFDKPILTISIWLIKRTMIYYN